MECISDDTHYAMCDLKSVSNISAQTWYRKIAKHYKDTNEEQIKTIISQTLDSLKEFLGRQYHLIGNKNAWILKPGG